MAAPQTLEQFLTEARRRGGQTTQKRLGPEGRHRFATLGAEARAKALTPDRRKEIARAARAARTAKARALPAPWETA